MNKYFRYFSGMRKKIDRWAHICNQRFNESGMLSINGQILSTLEFYKERKKHITKIFVTLHTYEPIHVHIISWNFFLNIVLMHTQTVTWKKGSDTEKRQQLSKFNCWKWQFCHIVDNQCDRSAKCSFCFI